MASYESARVPKQEGRRRRRPVSSCTDLQRKHCVCVAEKRAFNNTQDWNTSGNGGFSAGWLRDDDESEEGKQVRRLRGVIEAAYRDPFDVGRPRSAATTSMTDSFVSRASCSRSATAGRLCRTGRAASGGTAAARHCLDTSPRVSDTVSPTPTGPLVVWNIHKGSRRERSGAVVVVHRRSHACKRHNT